MLLLKQLEFSFDTIRKIAVAMRGSGPAIAARPIRLPNIHHSDSAQFPAPRHGRAIHLEAGARKLLCSLGATRLGAKVQVRWNSRLQTCAGRADSRNSLVSLNPRLAEHGADEVDRTLRHELAHLLAQFRAGRRRLLPHGPEWRQACRDLAIPDEARCHNLPFLISRLRRRFQYRCPNCKRDFPRVRRIRKTVACLACCRAHNHGKFDARFRLKLTTRE